MKLENDKYILQIIITSSTSRLTKELLLQLYRIKNLYTNNPKPILLCELEIYYKSNL